MNILTPEQMRAADRAAIAAGFPSLMLMENAAWASLRILERRFANLSEQRVAIFCGKGNNGGDGLALGRLIALHHRPKRLIVYVAFPREQLSADAAAQWKMLEELGI